jgi:hypothetical protein
MTTRKLRIENFYEGGDEPVVTEASLEVPSTDELAAQGRTWQDFVADELFAVTGTGRTEGDASYFVTSIDGLEPAISEEFT